MNKIKFRAADDKGAGVVYTAHIQQNPSPQQFSLRAPWGSPANVKARLLRTGFVLTGKRQAAA